MIKGRLFGKSLKQLFFSSLISCFILLGGSFVNGYKIQEVGLDSSPSIYDSNFDLTFVKGGGLISTFLGQSKAVVTFTDSIFFWWTPNGLPYLYFNSSVWQPQGFFNTYYVCDPITGLDSVPFQNCISYPITEDLSVFSSFFSNVFAGDYVSYNYFETNNNYGHRWAMFDICFSSSSLGKSICFQEVCNYNGTESCGSNLSNSQDYNDLTFSSIPRNSIGPAPGQAGYNGNYNGSSQGSTQGQVDSTITGDFVYSTCTVGYAKSKYEKYGLSPDLCFAGLSLDSSGVTISTPGTGVNVFDLYNATNDGRNFCEWYQFRVGNYVNRYVINPSIFGSQPSALYSYFDIINRLNPEMLDGCGDIQNYCKIIINNMDLNSTRNGSSSACPIVSGPGISDDGWDSVNNTGVVWDGKTPIGVNWNGVGGSSSVVEQKDALNFIQDFFNKARSVIPTDYSDFSGVGFLPTYIITFLLAIILFRFLSH